MASINLIDSFQEFKEAENIDRPTLMKVKGVCNLRNILEMQIPNNKG